MCYRFLFLFLFTPFISLAQDCIDDDAINPDCLCSFLYEPVCGCDGVLYNNPCEASECYGVTSYVSAYDENNNLIDCSTVATPNSICDSISVEVAFFNLMTEDDDATLVINMSTSFTSSVTFPYAGFTLINSDGETIAEEGMDAGNVYGFGANYSDTRLLYFYEYFSLPFEGTLLLYNGFFSGNSELACSFPIDFSIEGAGISLEGQYYLEQEFDYVEFTSDSIYIYDFEEDMECYEFINFEYLASDSVIVFLNEDLEEQILMNYQLNDENITLNLDGENIELINSQFEPSKWEECDDDSTSDCTISNVYAEAGECDSLGYFMVDIEFDVTSPMAYTFTIQGNATNYGSYEYGQTFYQIGPFLADGITDYEFVITDNEDSECSDYYELGTVSCEGSTGITSSNLSERRLLFIKNILGETVNKLKPNTPYIYFYNDGSFEKKINFAN